MEKMVMLEEAPLDSFPKRGGGTGVPPPPVFSVRIW